MASSSSDSTVTAAISAVTDEVAEPPFDVPLFNNLQGRTKAEETQILPAVLDVHANSFPLTAYGYGQRPREPEVYAQPNEIDDRYAASILHLELELPSRSRGVPQTVAGGRVAMLGVANMTFGGDAVFESVLEEHEVMGQRKKQIVKRG